MDEELYRAEDEDVSGPALELEVCVPPLSLQTFSSKLPKLLKNARTDSVVWHSAAAGLGPVPTRDPRSTAGPRLSA